jgi:hypothetical protein
MLGQQLLVLELVPTGPPDGWLQSADALAAIATVSRPAPMDAPLTARRYHRSMLKSTRFG